MAHEITIRECGKAEFAFCGNQAWHGLGSELTKDATIEQWITEAGLDWNIEETDIRYEFNHPEIGPVSRIVPDKKILFRSDTKKDLAIVGDKYNVVQPKEVLEFFRELTSYHGFTLSAAGSLMGGTRFWATAETGYSDKILGTDEIKGYLLLVTSADGTLATLGQFTSTRVVCANTLRVSLQNGAKSAIKVSHKRIFDPNSMKIDLGLISDSWDSFIGNINQLANKPMTDKQVSQFFKELEFNNDFTEEEQHASALKRVNELEVLYRRGAGADYGIGTAWGALNAVTNLYTHGITGSRKSASNRFMDTYFGDGDRIKSESFDKLLELC